MALHNPLFAAATGLALLALAPLAGAVALPLLAPVEAEPHVLALPGAWITTYATPVVAVPVGGPLAFANADLFQHNVVALAAYGDGAQPWCRSFQPGQCPLFWSPLVPLGGVTQVEGLDRLEPLGAYAYYCTLHPGMRGTLVATPPT